MIINENRTDSYIGTIDLSDPQDLRMVANIRKMVKLANKEKRYGDRPMYVKLQGRGPRPTRQFYQSLPLSLADRADVYIYSR